ncbi:MAG: hypothetical protein HFH35_08245 [Eubacterium sp.]|nr:hypothetical protein [Eubacterium sp.]
MRDSSVAYPMWQAQRTIGKREERRKNGYYCIEVLGHGMNNSMTVIWDKDGALSE